MLMRLTPNGIERVEKEPAELSDIEKNAISLIYEILQDANIDLSAIAIDKTKDYIKLSAEKHYTFCNIKVSGKKPYIELTLSSKDCISLANDTRLSGLEIGKKRLSRIPIDSVESIAKYSDLVCIAYRWATAKV